MWGWRCWCWRCSRRRGSSCCGKRSSVRAAGGGRSQLRLQPGPPRFRESLDDRLTPQVFRLAGGRILHATAARGRSILAGGVDAGEVTLHLPLGARPRDRVGERPAELVGAEEAVGRPQRRLEEVVVVAQQAQEVEQAEGILEQLEASIVRMSWKIWNPAPITLPTLMLWLSRMSTP